jgi:pimeloyl-ACP methyl ester carboxylesterase
MAAVGEVGLSAGTIRYEDVGRGPVLLFVHGLLVNGLLWRMPVFGNVSAMKEG